MEMYPVISFTIALAAAVFGNQFSFPQDFKFGVATASYQIEGGWKAGGKGENIWDRLTHEHPNWVKDHKTGDIACDSYHLWKDDVKLLKYLNVNFYRFSLSWSRLLPSGFANYINPDGVRYYNDLINELLKNDIEPMVTLYHWDLPQPLQEIGGWPNPLLAKHFEDYAKIAFELFGDRVKTWITFNEPPDVCEAGYGDGTGAPGFRSSGIGDYLCGRTLLLAHASAYRLYDKMFRSTQQGKIGITVDAIWAEPKSKLRKDIEAAERAMQMSFGWWTHPIYSKTGDYPQIMKDRVGNVSKSENFSSSRLPEFSADEIKYIQGTFDFLGLNHYSTWLVSDMYIPANAPVSRRKDVSVKQVQDPKWKPSAAGWLKDVPWGFRKLLNWIKNEFGNPLVFVTENGFADLGEMNDTGRIDYYTGYLNALLDAVNLDGCNVKAYTAWSVMDNMEWRDGYTLKFGLHNVNFTDPNRTRTPKASAEFYKNIIKTRTVPRSFPEVTILK